MADDVVIPTHGVGGWVLQDYTHLDGRGRFRYSHRETGEVVECHRPEPTRPEHEGWVSRA